MFDISATLHCLTAHLDKKRLRQLSLIIRAMLAISGRITMLGISRWTEKGGSYRTIQRFFDSKLLWCELHWRLLRSYLVTEDDIYLLADDEVVVTKAGKRTFGLDRFFSSLYGRPVKGLCFFSLSLISVKRRNSYPLGCWQIVRSSEEQAVNKEHLPGKQEKGRRGRPKGSKNRDKVNVKLGAHLRFVQGCLQPVLKLLRSLIGVNYLVLDGAYDYNEVMQLARQLDLALISKLKRNAALYFPYEGAQKARGAKRKYGQKLDYQRLPATHLQSTTASAGVQTDIYQLKALHKEFGQPLNLVVIVKTKLASGERAHVLLFSSDLSLACEQLIDYYSLRFQLEFNFRDAKQFWGLEDFMHLKERSIHNAANLSLFMVNLSKVLLSQLEPVQAKNSVLDLKAHFRAEKYALETLKLLPQKPDAFLIRQSCE
ncbi:MAG: transposase [Truepera sp.]|nr:transposase [Truepera sp.]